MARSFEVRVDDWVRERLNSAGLKYHTQHDLPSDLSAALEKASKSGTGSGNPDFATIPREGTLCVIIENKYGIDKLESRNDKGVLLKTKKAVNDYATNGALHYGQKILESGKFKEVIAIGIAGETTEKGLENLEVASSVHYMFSANDEPKFIDKKITRFDFLNDDNFDDFYREISLSDEEKARVLDKSYSDLQKTAKDLNRLFYDHSITVEQRVVFVSGMLLAMQAGLTPDQLTGLKPGTTLSDGNKIHSHIAGLLDDRVNNEHKRSMMLSTFSTLKADLDRDRVREGKTITRGTKKGEKTPGTSINKEIFTFIYENVFLTIDQSSHLDSLGEMYSSFLKYALGDGKENGIVLTPPYVTKAMCEMIGIDRESRVFDPCTGSGGFLVTAMSEMIEDTRADHQTQGLGKDETKNKIKEIQESQLMGLENDLKMFSLASTNMILRGDGSTTILKGSTFDLVKEREVKDFAPTRALLNPPFSYSENGMPFTLATLDIMDKGGKVALIIQDSAGTGKSISTNKKILENHTLLASIRMPGDLFEPSAGVQTSIYLFKAHVPHDVRKKVRFIDFSDDGYKRTGRGLRKISNPDQRYEALKEVIKYGTSPDGVDIPFIDDVITLNGDDWNYTQHQVFDTVPKEEDFLKTVGDYMGFELSLILSGKGDLIGFSDEDMKKAEEEASGNNDREAAILRELHPVDDATETGEQEELDLDTKETAEFRVGDLFNVVTGSLVERDDLIEGDIPRVTASSDNNGVTLRISENVNGARYFSNIVTVSFLADSFYHPGVVSLEMKVHGISPKDNEFTLGSGLYVSAAIRKEISQKYGYGNQLSSSRIVNEHLSLPATPDGEPDWDWMDRYIKQIEERERANRRLSHRKEEAILAALASR